MKIKQIKVVTEISRYKLLINWNTEYKNFEMSKNINLKILVIQVANINYMKQFRSVGTSKKKFMMKMKFNSISIQVEVLTSKFI